MNISYVFLLLLSFFASYIFTKILQKYLTKKSIMDIPNNRSMHKIPVPRGGGLAVMMIIIAGMLYYMPNPFLIISIAILMMISWIDDRKNISSSIRLISHLIAAFIGSFAFDDHMFFMNDIIPFWANRLIIVICWAWIMNLYNFMDGIDGITATQTITNMFGFALLISLFNIDFVGIELSIVIMGACYGFLILNWHPAKIFMGDVGSIPLGFIMGFFIFKLAFLGYAIPALLIPLYYLMDSGITITKRALQGKKIWLPHKEHFYQKATEKRKNPKPIVFYILIANLCLTITALISVPNPWLGIIIGAMIVTILLITLQKQKHENINL